MSTIATKNQAFKSATPAAKFGARFSPRRKLYAQCLLTFLNTDKPRWRDSMVRFTDDTYAAVADDIRLDRFAVNQAIDDLFALGLVEVEMRGDVQAVIPLAVSIVEAAESQPASHGRRII